MPYDAFYQQHDHRKPPGFETATSALLSRILPPGARVLDVGCGTGAAVTAFTGDGFRAVGIDLSHVALTRARQRSDTPAGVLLADALAAPFPPHSFDAVYCSALSLFNVPDLQSALPHARLIAALVRPGGFFVFVGNSTLRSGGTPTWHYHTLPHFRAFMAPLGDVLMLRAAPYRLIGWLGAAAFHPLLGTPASLWNRASGRPAAVVGIVRIP